MTPREQLVDRVFDQMQEDMRNGEFTVIIQELLSHLPDRVLNDYLALAGTGEEQPST